MTVLGWVAVATLAGSVLWFCWVVDNDARTARVVRWIEAHRRGR